MRLIISILFIVAVPFVGIAQLHNDSNLHKELEKMDNLLFEESFSNCNMDVLRKVLSEDLEFYHDKNGITKGKAVFINSFEKNMCEGTQKLRRELVAGSLEVFPLYENGNLYGAIQKGVHEFYIEPAGKPAFKTGIAKFSHLWLKEDGQWKLSRGLSYDHQPPTQDLIKVSVPQGILATYVGNYKAPNSGNAVIAMNNGVLHLKAGKMETDLIPISAVAFGHPQAPLTFEFIKGTDGNIHKFIVKENGTAVEEAIRTN